MSDGGDDRDGQASTVDDGYLQAAAEHDVPPIDFRIFVASLNTSALIHLGDAPGEGDGSEVNLAMARHTIDMLGLLEEKTRGNLTGAEERLLNQVLFDLRLRFTQKAKAGGTP